MKVKITSAYANNLWYSHKIGQTFEAVFQTKTDDWMVIEDLIEKKGKKGPSSKHINKNDCEVVSDQNDNVQENLLLDLKTRLIKGIRNYKPHSDDSDDVEDCYTMQEPDISDFPPDELISETDNIN